MRYFIFLFIGLVLMSCGANNSTPAKKARNVEPDTVAAQAPIDPPLKAIPAVNVDTMTAEELAVATNVGAIRAIKMAEDTFLVKKFLSAEAYQKIIAEWEPLTSFDDSVLLTGVVSAKGKWWVPLRYHDVHQIAKDVFIGHLNVNRYDYDEETPAYEELYQVVYNGQPVGKFSYKCDIMPIYYRDKVAGFMKTYYSRSSQMCYRYYIDTRGKGWDAWIGEKIGSYPHFEYYKVSGSVLTIWGGAKKPEDLAAFFPEDRALYQVDLKSGRVLANPYVASD